MLSKNKQKLIRSLQQKKFRDMESLFLVEGTKMVRELLGSGLKVSIVAGTERWISENKQLLYGSGALTEVVEEAELKKLSSFTTPQEVLAVAEKPGHHAGSGIGSNELCLALDRIQDPGNLGTIIRLADWFGITKVFCSEDTADLYNPKVVQATMGSLFRVNPVYLPLHGFLSEYRKNRGNVVYGTFPGGSSVYETELTPGGMIILGNEAAGISPGLEEITDRKISVPPYPGRGEIDSLNVSLAAAIVCAEFRRRVAFNPPS